MENTKCTLMHKNVPVVDVTIKNISIVEIGDLHNVTHLPIGTQNLNAGQGIINRRQLNDWWTERSIPMNRDNLDTVLHILKILSPKELISKSFGLSLSDQYWMCPKDSGLTWSSINFFDNVFSPDIGEILFGREPEDLSDIDMMSPDNTTDGWLQKKWIISGGECYLMKGSGGGFEQEPFNEVIATAIMRRLDIPHVPYTLTFHAGKPYSLCENFVTPETELIPAWHVIQTLKKTNNDSDLTHLLRCCDNLGIPGVPEAIDKMLTLDYIIEYNEDRHYNNFGFIRDADTLEWIGTAPIYDSGTSLWLDDPRVGSKTGSKPFKSTHVKQIKLVNNLDWFYIETLKGIKDECEEIFSKSNLAMPERWTAIANAVWERAERIQRIQRIQKMRNDK